MARYSGSSTATGALSGAATGAVIGSVVPVVGTAVGAIGGAIVGGLSGLFGSKTKKKKKPKQISTLDPQQRKLYNDYVAALRGQGPNAGLFNYNAEEANKNFEANVANPAYRQYRENVIPGITGQFRSNNIGNSSYTGEALSRHGRDIQESLNAARSQMHTEGQREANSNKIQGLNQILNTNTFDYQNPSGKGQSSIDNILGQITPAAGEYIFDYLKDLKKNPSPTAPTAAPTAAPAAAPAI